MHVCIPSYTQSSTRLCCVACAPPFYRVHAALVCLHLQGTPSEVSSVSGSEVSSIESAVGVERLQKLMARMKEYQAQIPLLEEQLQQQTQVSDEWQRHCEELQEQHTQELHALEAGHEAALMRLRAELHGGRESPSAAVCCCYCSFLFYLLFLRLFVVPLNCNSEYAVRPAECFFFGVFRMVTGNVSTWY